LGPLDSGEPARHGQADIVRRLVASEVAAALPIDGDDFGQLDGPATPIFWIIDKSQ